MSMEFLLLIIAFLVLPLIQHLIRAVRQQQGQPPAQAEGQQSPEDWSPIDEWQAPLTSEDRAVMDAEAATEPQEARATPPKPRAPVLRRSVRRGAAGVAGLRNPRDLRRAIVLMTVLEPCRAVRPHEGPP
jgi:hypothetical protein